MCSEHASPDLELPGDNSVGISTGIACRRQDVLFGLRLLARLVDPTSLIFRVADPSWLASDKKVTPAIRSIL